MPNRPTVLAYLNGMPDVESTYPVLARLHARGRVTVRALVYSKLLRKENRLPAAFAAMGLVPEPASKLRMKLLYGRDIRRSDAVLTIADPNFDTTTRKQRGAYIIKTGHQSIFLQHGAYQLGVNGPYGPEPMAFYSQRLLHWEPFAPNAHLFEPGTAERVDVVGFTKQNILPARTWGPEVNDWVAKHPRRLLVCQSFRWGQGRFSADHIDHFYDLMDAILTRHPDLGVIIRSHRGKVRKNHRAHDAALAKKHPNVLFSHYYAGPLAKATIHDTIDLCHAMVTPVSTTVLDCIYCEKPAAVFAEDVPIFHDLPQISDLETLEGFIAQMDTKGPGFQSVKARFGEFESNLERAAQAIENHVLGSKP